MPEILLNQTYTIQEEGETLELPSIAYANQWDYVWAVLTIESSGFPQGKIPLLYLTQVDSFDVFGEVVTYEDQSSFTTGWGTGQQVQRNDGSNLFIVYRRRNNIRIPMVVRWRIINLSV